MIARLRSKGIGWMFAGFALLALGGCQDLVDEVPPPRVMQFPPPVDVNAGAPAAMPVAQNNDPKLWQPVVAARMGAVKPRPDAFALMAQEQSYDVKQTNLGIFNQMGGFYPPTYTHKPIVVQEEVVEPQPYRRLAGVIVGESVMAVIDMGDGRPMQVIRPGARIPNSPWMVASIDEEKAILRRSGNVKPKEVVVRLETAPSFIPIQSGGDPSAAPVPTGPGEQPGRNNGRGQGGPGASGIELD